MQGQKIFKSVGDKNEYHHFELANKLEVILIQDNNNPESSGEEIAYCCLSVNAGSFNDPEGSYGMAHFMEHMIFIGSEKYKQPSAFSDHIASNGGVSNGQTDFEWTVFDFEVSYSGLQVALDMLASQLEAPLLLQSGIEKEINAIESEFAAAAADDTVRQVMLLMNECAQDDHIFKTFPFGNKKSLNNVGDFNKLSKEVRDFYNSQYSADRMKLVVQVKTKDNMAEVRQWISESFCRIQNKNLGKQDYSKISMTGPQSPTCGQMPFEGVNHEVICCDSICESNAIMIFWFLPHTAYDYQNKQSLTLIMDLLSNQSEGSLLHCLKSLNYATEIQCGEDPSIQTAFKCINIWIQLTDEGLQDYQKVLVLLFEYKRKLQEEWLAEGKSLDVWQEQKTVSNLKYDVYKARPAEEHVTEISNAMIWCKDVSKVIKMTQETPIIDDIDIEDIKCILGDMRWDNCKIVVGGIDLVDTKTSSEQWKQEVITEPAKGQWFGTNFVKCQKPEFQSIKDLFKDKELMDLYNKLQMPPKNRFIPNVPEGLQIISKVQQNENNEPEFIKFTPSHSLYHVLDNVYHKPETTIHIILKMVQPDKRQNELGKPVNFLQTPHDYAMFSIAKNCFESQLNSRIGFEAQLANLTAEIKLVDGCALDIKINGFSQKIFQFATDYIQNLVDFVNCEFDRSQYLKNSIQTSEEEYATETRITYHTQKNMDLYLMPHTFHDSCVLKEIEKMLEMDEIELENIDPQHFLTERVMNQISSVHVLVTGNTPKIQAEKFYREQILPNFKTVDSSTYVDTQVSCLQPFPGEITTLLSNANSALKSVPDTEINPKDMKMFDLIQRGEIGGIIWDCVANEDAEEEEVEEDIVVQNLESGRLSKVKRSVTHQPKRDLVKNCRTMFSGGKKPFLRKLNSENLAFNNNFSLGKIQSVPMPMMKEVAQTNLQPEIASLGKSISVQKVDIEEQEEEEQEVIEEEDQEQDEDDYNSGNSIEIFFQPKKFGLKELSYIEILVAILNEKMFNQLRQKEQLCYKLGCEVKRIASTVGITLFIQSDKYDPEYLQLRVLDFLDNFYYDTFNENLFKEYKKGLLQRKKSRFSSIDQEASELRQRIFNWSLDSQQMIDWNHKQKLISYIENECSFDHAKEFYKEMFCPYKRADVSYTSQQVVKLTKLKIFEENPLLGLDQLIVFISNEGINFDDQAAIDKIRAQDVLKQVQEKFSQKHFLCLRIFSKKNEEMIRFQTLENFAIQGKLLPSPNLIRLYMAQTCTHESIKDDNGPREAWQANLQIGQESSAMKCGQELPFKDQLEMLKLKVKDAESQRDHFRSLCEQYVKQQSVLQGQIQYCEQKAKDALNKSTIPKGRSSSGKSNGRSNSKEHELQQIHEGLQQARQLCQGQKLVMHEGVQSIGLNGGSINNQDLNPTKNQYQNWYFSRNKQNSKNAKTPQQIDKKKSLESKMPNSFKGGSVRTLTGAQTTNVKRQKFIDESFSNNAYNQMVLLNSQQNPRQQQTTPAYNNSSKGQNILNIHENDINTVSSFSPSMRRADQGKLKSLQNGNQKKLQPILSQGWTKSKVGAGSQIQSHQLRTLNSVNDKHKSKFTRSPQKQNKFLVNQPSTLADEIFAAAAQFQQASKIQNFKFPQLPSLAFSGDKSDALRTQKMKPKSVSGQSSQYEMFGELKQRKITSQSKYKQTMVMAQSKTFGQPSQEYATNKKINKLSSIYR